MKCCFISYLLRIRNKVISNNLLLITLLRILAFFFLVKANVDLTNDALKIPLANWSHCFHDAFVACGTYLGSTFPAELLNSKPHRTRMIYNYTLTTKKKVIDDLCPQ